MQRTGSFKTRNEGKFVISDFECRNLEGVFLTRIAISQNTNSCRASRVDTDRVESIWQAFCSALSWKCGLLEKTKLVVAETKKNHDSYDARVVFVANGAVRQGNGRDFDSDKAIAQALVSALNE